MAGGWRYLWKDGGVGTWSLLVEPVVLVRVVVVSCVVYVARAR